MNESIMPATQQWLLLNSRDECLRIDFKKIVFFEADGNYTNIQLQNKLRCTVGVNLATMGGILAEQYGRSVDVFARIGKKYIINLNCVFRINVLKHQVVLTDTKDCTYNLDISKEALKKLKEIMITKRI